MLMYEASVPQFSKMLANLARWIDKAEEHAKQRSFDIKVLLDFRLAPDMYCLIEQVQSACDGAKFACARLAGKQAPSHPDTEETLPEVRARIQSVLSYLETFKPEEFAGSEDRVIALPYYDNRQLLGKDYLIGMSLPNFYFHAAMAYAILRHNGVPLGKNDFLGAQKFRG